MSAIAGVIRFDGQAVSPKLVERMISTMPHRSPDGQGVWAEGVVGMGHGMMHTTPESLHEQLPLTTDDGQVVITSNSRIDNRDGLLPQLDLDPSAPDSSVILHAYLKWGEECLEHLVGDFSFAIWDGRAEKLFVARDQFGVKPLYYHHQPGRLIAFATEIKAILSLSDVTPQLNEIRVADFLARLREDHEHTIYEGIFRLPAAHNLVVENGAVRIERYYTLAPAALPEMSEEEYVERFREHFFEAVRCRLRSAFPVGSQLSGGLDSSSVTCAALAITSEKAGEPLHSFSLVFPSVESADERTFIEAIVDEGGLIPHFIRGDETGPLSNVEALYEVLDDGLVGGNQHLVWLLLKAAKEAGTRVVLDGVDGDQVVSHGELRFKELARDGDWEAFAREAWAAVARYAPVTQKHDFERLLSSADQIVSQFALPELRSLAEHGRLREFYVAVAGLHNGFGISRTALVRRFARQLLVPALARRLWRRLRKQDPTTRFTTPALVDRRFAERIDLKGRIAAVGDPGFRFEGVRQQQLELLSGARLPTALEMTDHAGALFSLDVRHPFFDRRLVEFCLALPASLSLRDGWSRYVLRKAVDEIMPSTVTWRVGKAWMSDNFATGLFVIDGPLLDRHLDDLGPLAGFVDIDFLRGLREQGQDLPSDMQAQLARVATLSAWMKKRFAAAPTLATLA